ncbi:MAG TPA: OPT family oligopeptide transporter [bacterium]|nr:OPT family oligopeptide transporter [bacterium]
MSGKRSTAIQDENAKIAADHFLGIDTAGKKAEEIELEWFENHYHGDMPQLTLRAVLMGMFLGGIMSLSNLYIGLKTGWGLGVAITACILSYSLGSVMQKVGLLKTNLSILENNCMQSTASSAGYSTGGALVSAIAALLMIEGQHLNFWLLMVWTIFLAILGVTMAIPMKRQMINIEQLRFPSGVAAAETLRSLYAKGEDATKKASALLYAGLVGAVMSFFKDNTYSWYPEKFRTPYSFDLPAALKMKGRTFSEWTISWDNSLIMIAAGALIGIRTGWSMLAGAILNFGVLAPMALAAGELHLGATGELGYRQIVDWSLWPGAAIMVTSGLMTFLFGWRTIGRAFAGIKNLIPSANRTVDPRLTAMEAIEVPGSWFILGVLFSGLGCMAILAISFSVSWWMGALSVVMTFFLGIVACRATGETDITPIGAMGKITQLMYGVLAPAHRVAGGALQAAKINLMTACVTAGAAGSSADLLTDLKSGYLLGANPRRQFLAQFWGIFAGAAVIVPAFYLLVPDASVLGSAKFPAPAAQVWKGVAELLSQGLGVLSESRRWGLAIGGLVGILLAIADKVTPSKYKMYVPSSMGLGLAFVIPFYNTLSMFVGALIVHIMSKRKPQWSEDYTVPIASGVIAGESLMGVFLNLSTLNFNEIWQTIRGTNGAAAVLPTPTPEALAPAAMLTPEVVQGAAEALGEAAAVTPVP